MNQKEIYSLNPFLMSLNLILLYFWLGENGLNFGMQNNLLLGLVATVVLTKL